MNFNYEKMLLSPNEAARILGCTVSKVRKDIFERKIEIVKIGSLVRIRRQHLEQIIKDNTRPVVSGGNSVRGQ